MTSGTRTVLLVEDNLLLAQILSSTLEGHGCRVTHAMKARDALTWLSTNEPHLVVLDDELPDGWGADIALALRAQARDFDHEGEAPQPLPIIAMQSDVGKPAAEPWIADRRTIVINKPIQLPAFSALVRQYLDASALPTPVDVDLEELEDADPLSAYGEEGEDDEFEGEHPDERRP